MNTLYKFLIIAMVLAVANSCKSDWLEIKPDKGLVVPETLDDLQAVLTYATKLNEFVNTAGRAGNDLIWIADEDIGSLSQEQRSLYTWSKEIMWNNERSLEWNYYFENIELANIVLDGLEKIDEASVYKQNISGQAHFFRAFWYYNLMHMFCKPYQKSTVATDLGLPIRRTSDVNQLQKRSSLEELYTFIMTDLLHAASSLDLTSEYTIRPNKLAAWAMLSKLNLGMGNYEKAKEYADSVLTIQPEILDFNNSSIVSASNPYSFLPRGKDNPEIIFYVKSYTTRFESNLPSSIIQAEKSFFNGYDENDLRKQFFFSNDGTKVKFKGTYTGESTSFCGLATNEVYLIRAECNARINKLDQARADLNFLLRHRYRSGSYSDITENDKEKLLDKILEERKKELPKTANIRWEDLRRLNLEPRLAKTLTRTMADQVYQLPPNDLRYTLPIPLNEIRMSALEQNPR